MKKLIPDCYWPGANHGSYVSHESICVLNTGERPAKMTLTLYFEDREPLAGFTVTVPARRTRHIRMDALVSPRGDRVPRDTPYCSRATRTSPCSTPAWTPRRASLHL